MSGFAYVDSLAAMAAAREAGWNRIVTDVPPLAALPQVAGFVHNIESAIAQAQANIIGDTTTRLSLMVDERLRASSLPSSLGLIGGMVQTAGGFGRLSTALLHRAAVMSEAQARTPGNIGLFTHSSTWLKPGQLLSADRFASPFPDLAARGFFGERSVSVRSIPAQRSSGEAPSTTVSGLRKVAHLPTPLLVEALLSRFGTRKGGQTIVVGVENETIREAAPWLRKAGFNLRRIGNKLLRPAAGQERAPNREAVAELLQGVFRCHLEEAAPFTPAQCEALEALLLDHLSSGLADMASRMEGLRTLVAEIFDGDRASRVFLTNGLFGLLGAQLYGILREHGVTVIDCEHGVTTGLSEHSQRKIAYSEASAADHVLVCSENSARHFAEARRADSVGRHVVGLPVQVRRVLRKPLQRLLHRRALGLDARTELILHVATWPFSGNMRPGFGVPSDTIVLETSRTLVNEVYGKLGKRVVYKSYPTQRYPDEPTLAEFVPAPPGVSYAPSEDLRYLRAAADIIVTCSPTSTLGWIVGANVPIVWLDSRIINPVINPPWHEVIRDSFLVVDIDAEDWAETLRRLLAQPLSELSQAYDKRAAARQFLYSSAVLGPNPAAGRVAAKVIANIASSLPPANNAGQSMKKAG